MTGRAASASPDRGIVGTGPVPRSSESRARADVDQRGDHPGAPRGDVVEHTRRANHRRALVADRAADVALVAHGVTHTILRSRPARSAASSTGSPILRIWPAA